MKKVIKESQLNPHIVIPPEDTPELREEFLERTEELGELLKHLREEKMKVYGMNWLRRGWDSLFQNVDRKFGIIEEILWEKIIQQRTPPSDEDFIHLADAFIDLANYAQFGRWFMEYMYPETCKRLEYQIADRTEVARLTEDNEDEEEGLGRKNS